METRGHRFLQNSHAGCTGRLPKTGRLQQSGPSLTCPPPDHAMRSGGPAGIAGSVLPRKSRSQSFAWPCACTHPTTCSGTCGQGGGDTSNTWPKTRIHNRCRRTHRLSASAGNTAAHARSRNTTNPKCINHTPSLIRPVLDAN